MFCICLYTISYRGWGLAWMCLYEYAAIIVIVPINEKQKQHYGFLTRQEIDRLPMLTEEDKELKLRMENILQQHEDYMFAEENKRKEREKESMKNNDQENEEDDEHNEEVTTDEEEGNDEESKEKVEDDTLDTNNKSTSKKESSKDKVGRHSNAVYPFDIRHPQFSTHIQCIRSKLCIPELLGRIPRLPKTLNQKSEKQQIQVAIFMLTLFKPWCVIDHVPLGGLTWENFLTFVRSLNHNDADSSSRNIFFTMENILHGLVISAKKSKIFGMYRGRATVPWGVHKQIFEKEKEQRKVFTETLRKIINEKKLQDVDIPDDEDYNDVEEFSGKSGLDMPDEGENEENNYKDIPLDELYQILVQNNLTGENKYGQVDVGRIEAMQYNNKACNIMENLYKDLPIGVQSGLDISKQQNMSSMVKRIDDFSEEPSTDTLSPERLQGKEYLDALLDKMRVPKTVMGEQIDIVKIVNQATSTDEDDQSVTGEGKVDEPTDLIENQEEDAYGIDIVDRRQLNQEQEYVCTKFYKIVRHNINHFVDPTTTLCPSDPIYMIVQGGPGCGKTTLFKELIKRIEAYLSRKRQRFRDIIAYKARNHQTISNELRGCIERINKVVFGIKQSATTGVAAVVVGNNCETMHSAQAVPIFMSKKKTSAKNAYKKTDKYRSNALNPIFKVQLVEEFKGSGCFVIHIDEVRRYYYRMIL